MSLQRCTSTSTIDIPARSASSSSFETVSSSGGSVSRGRRRARMDVARRNGCNVVAKKNGRTVVNLRVDNFVLCVPRMQVATSLPGGKSDGIFLEQEEQPASPLDCPPANQGWYVTARYWLNKLRPAAVAVGSAIVFLIGRVGIGLRGEDIAWLLRPGCQHTD